MRSSRCALAILVVAACVAAAVAQRKTDDLVGAWRGRVDVNGSAWPVTLHVVKDEAHGKLTGVIDNLDQSNNPFTADVSFNPKTLKVHIEIHQLDAAYDGKLNDSGDTIDGAWVFAGIDLPCLLKLQKPDGGGTGPPS